jgi:hypothetical protein
MFDPGGVIRRKKEGTDDLIGPFFVLHCLLDYWA